MKSTEDYQKEFLEFQPQLKSFIYRLVTNAQDTEDLMQDVYIKAFDALASFQGKSSFKTWVFTIASNKSKDHLRSQKRWHEDYQDNCRTATYNSAALQEEMGQLTATSPHGRYVINEHIEFCFTCMSKTLLVEEQVCIMLKEIYSFKIQEIITITGLTEGKVKHALANARKRYHKIFNDRCSLINKKGVCHQCTELNGLLNPTQDSEQATLAVKLVKERDRLDFDKLLDLRMALVRNINPLEGEGFDLHNYMLETLPDHSKD